MDAIPIDLKRAIGAGIGLFIAFIGLKGGGLVVINTQTALPQLGNLKDPGTLVAAAGLVITAILVALRVRGGILLGIIATALIGFIPGITKLPEQIVSLNLDLSTVGAALSADAWGALSWGLAGIVFAFLLTDFFDTMGTVISVGGQAGFLTKEGKLPGLRNVLLVDSLAAVVGGLFGASSATTYVESASGVSVGGRTGLTSVTTGILFLLTLAFVPIVGVVPAQATAPALIVVGYLMISVAKDIDWSNSSSALPAFLTLVGIPFFYSIADGIGVGVLTYVLVQLFSGKAAKVHPLLYAVGALFVVHFFLK
jgi:AGZA family xanthine/uracil permease-like MFS transporter